MRKSILLAAIRQTVIPATLFAFACAAYGDGHPISKEDPYVPEIRPQSQEGQEAIGHIHIAPGLKIELWAAEPMLANPVCMRVDNQDRVYVVETFRHTSNVLDIRQHMDWLTDDLCCRTVDDRIAMLKKKMGPNIRKMTRDDDRVRLLQDTTGSGVANESKVFASGFNKIESGIAAGILPTPQGVYYADIPDLWLLKDTKGDGIADERKALSSGYGVHVSFLGHDLHGLKIGPDHKLYFSIGDRGANAKAIDGSTVYLPDAGGVLRCNLDGTHLEIFATGLRNPQQLCFDDLGNLMTGDNNPDYGDPARWVYVVEGGDSGWRIGYQEDRNPRGGGPWMWESLWQTSENLKDAAYILPPVAHLGSGPSGVQFYPGTGLPEKYNRHFFMADFRGGSSGSSVHSFALEPNGASYKLVDHAEFIKGLLVTDFDFSTRGGMYASDWTEGWDKPGKGRIYRIFDPNSASDPVVEETHKLLSEGFDNRSVDELGKLLSHRDQRVRLGAQFALAEKGAAAELVFAGIADKGANQLARLHAIWGLGELGEKTPAVYEKVIPLLGDADAEVRAQAAKVLGDGHVGAAYDGLVKLLADSQARPKFFAAIALSHLGRHEAIAPLLAMLKENNDKDAHLRHAAVMGLVGSGDVNTLMESAKDPSPAVRLGVLLTLRRLARPEIAGFLNDTDPHLVSEAAHAIDDVPIPEAYPQLATLLQRSNLPETVILRAVNAAYRVGTPQSAKELAMYAGKPGPAELEIARVEALEDLGAWAEPSPLDRIMNMDWPLPKRDEAVAQQAAGLAVAEILHPTDAGVKVPDSVQKAAVTLISALKIKDTAVLFDLVSGKDYTPDLRAEALNALADRSDPKLEEAVKIGLSDSAPQFREAAIRSLAKLSDATPKLQQYIATGSVGEQQAALAALASVASPESDKILSDSLDELVAGKWKPELQLDLVEAAQKRNAPEMIAKVGKFNESLPKTDPLAEYRVALVGGNATAGHAVFERSDASCVRCHTVHGTGGQVGPVLDGVGTRQNREYLLESIVLPNAKIAPGFETAVIKLKDGNTVTGIVKKETPVQVSLLNADGQLINVATADILSRTHGVSAMPEGFGNTLSKRDLRDLVEFLAQMKN